MNDIKIKRAGQKSQSGFSLIELLIIMGVISALATFAIIGYNEYMNSASISKVNSHYNEAVRLSKAVFMKNQLRAAISGVSSRPKSQQEWIDLFNKSEVIAPGGGPAFEASETGNAATGAIGIQAKDNGSEVIIVRPAYIDIVAVSATLTVNSEVFLTL